MTRHSTKTNHCRIVALCAILCLAPANRLYADGDSKDPPALPDLPLRSRVHFSAIHYAEGKKNPRQVEVHGTLDGPGNLTLNPNDLTLDDRGRILETTLLATEPIPVRIKRAKDRDPSGRKIYDLIPEKEATQTFALILSPTEAGPHHLLIRENGKPVGTYPMVDPGRERHLHWAPKLAKASVQEQQAIIELRKINGYSFQFEVENNAITFVQFPDPGDISTLDPGLKGLRNLNYLSFLGGRLGPKGVPSLQGMSALKTLSFSFTEIDARGLACVKGLTQLDQLFLYQVPGLSDEAMVNLAGLKNLTLLDLRNELYTETEPKTPRVTDAGLKHLAGLARLEYLNLTGHHITDAGLNHLKDMSNLQTLALSFFGITDAGLPRLEGLRKLNTLHLYDTRVTREGRAALKAKLPDLDR